MARPLFRWLLAVSGVVLLVAACESGTVGGPEIPSQDPSLVAAGEVLYAANCAERHGADLRGTDLGPSHLSSVYEPNHHSDGAFEVAIKVGSPQHHWPFGPMEPVGGLSDTDITAIVAFVRETQRTQGFEPYPPS